MFEKNTTLKAIAFFCLLLSAITTYGQTTYYYVGGDATTNDFTAGAAWSTTLGGTPVGGTIAPSATTNYVVDGSDVSSTSGAQPGTTVTLNLGASRTIGLFTILNNNISVSVTGLNYTLTCGDVTVNTGCTLNNQTVISTGGNLVNNGSLTYGTSSGEFTFIGINKTISGSATTQFRKITIATGATTLLQRDIDITGNLVSFVNGVLDAQTYLIKESVATTASVSLGAAGTLRTSNLTGVRGIVGATIDPALTLSMTNGNTIEFYAPSGVQDIWCGNSTAYYYNVVISGGGTKRLVNAAATWIDVRGSLTIGANNTLDASATLDATNIKNIEFAIDFTNNGTFTARTNKVTVAGSGGTQVLTMNGSSLYDLELANPTSNAASLGSDATLTHYLYFTNGRLLLGNYNFIFDVNADKAPASTPSNLKMLVTNGNGEVKKVIAAGGQQFTYFVGDITGTAEYSPVTLNFTANFASRTVGTRVVDAQHPNDGTVTSYISRYWHFSTSPTTGTYTYNATYTFLAADLVGTFAPMLASYIYLPNTTWIGVTSTPSATTIVANGVTETTGSLNGAEVTGRVTAGCTPPAQPAAFTVSSANVCPGQTGVTYTVPNDPSVTYSWSYSGTNTTINGNGNSVTLDFAANATGGTLSVTAINVCSSTPRTITITVNPNVGSPTFTAGPTTLCTGATATYTATASNSTTITYSIVGNTGASINSSTGVVSNVTGNFTVRATATGACGNPTTADISVTVTNSLTITQQPQPQTACFNGSATFSVVAGGSNMQYQWMFNGNDIGGANGPSYTIPVATQLNAGNYSVTITSNCGNATSNSVALTVLPVQIAFNSATICNGDSYTFQGIEYFAQGTYYDTLQSNQGCDSIEVLNLTVTTLNPVATVSNNVNLSTGNFTTYQWLFNGNPINNAISQNYTATQNGNYSVIVTSGACSDTSNIITITTIGLNELEASISIYPNPVNDVLYIKTTNIAGDKLSYTVCDLMGRKLTQSIITNTNQIVDLSGYAPGMYMLTITNTAGQKLTHRIVKAE